MQKFLSAPRTWRTMAEIQKVPYLANYPKVLDSLRRAGLPLSSSVGPTFKRASNLQ